jgi:broad specificity phosphatase PhoE/CTP:molybdopterin cytidylyltransferase MocA
MNEPFSPAAVVLAAGYSSRMGCFKPLLPIGAYCALAQVIRSLKSAGVKKVAVVTGYQREMLLPVIFEEGAEEAFNPDYDFGMFSSVKAGLSLITRQPDALSGILLSPVDCPLVSAETIRAVLGSAAQNPDCFIVPSYKGKKGHPLWIPAVRFPEILDYNGDMGLKGVTNRYDDKLIRLETDDEGAVLDMDTPEAYRKLLSYANRGGGVDAFASLAQNRRFLLIRHGKTEQHREKIFLGQYDPPLSEEGERQAAETARALMKLAPDTDTIYTSDLRRARRTAECIGVSLLSRVIALPGLREMSLGSWDGQFISDIRRNYPEEYEKRGKHLLTYKPDLDSENFYDLQYRVLDCLCDLLKEDNRRDIVIVSHSGVIKALYGVLSGHDIAWALSACTPGYADITGVET